VAGELKPDFPVPRHVAIIMDGNGRWARRSGWHRLRGHEAGAEAVRDTTTAAAAWGIRHLMLYSFSVENWQRPREEVEGLMDLLCRYLEQELPTLLENDVRLRTLGRVQDLPETARRRLRETEEATRHCQRLTLRLALSYGGRQEIVDAARRLAEDVATGRLDLAAVDEAALAARLYDPDMPDPDLVIRTAGEQRLSNFLLWQGSYAEFWFTRVLWPDFRREHFLEALRDYHGRVRRFGRVVEEDPAVPPAR